ncbi:MAG: response regulator receiver Signal transduction histidine kinase [Panacagrimonas sp.]|nr:hybrid sensor histidine kinase/response regulator [Panacagrimonas sp.]MCC2655731.1 response regulator receiver Signal transduction histidine kinase [Panacagrimonas sp.]
MTRTQSHQPAKEPDAAEPWQILVVDDDPEVLAVTRLCLRDFRFANRPVVLLDADSAAAARAVLARVPDIALILLDVVMETEHAGLDLVRYVRENLENAAVRIVLRTGQPGQAPAMEVAERYQIDDYRTKTELTFERLQVLVTTALRTYGLVRQLESRSRALAEHASELERFSYVASHDMQTPLANIARLVQLLERRLADILTDRQRELMELLVSSTHDLQQLISDLLALARIGREEIDRSAPVDLNRTLERILGSMQVLIDDRRVRIEVGPLPVVEGHAVLLEQLLRNLIDNAIKFQPQAQPYVNITGRETTEGWEVRVQDAGIGIDAEHLQRIFEPFQRLHTREAFPGSGVGLAICRRVARMHGGTIVAESSPGQGTTMVVRLARHGAPTSTAGETPATGAERLQLPGSD